MFRGPRMIEQLKEMAEDSMADAQPDHATLPPEHEMRDFGLGAQIIRDLGLKRITVISDHPKEMVGMAGYGIEVSGHVPLS
jgi:3,4-dihydroxy 2-butanone 4-phosphate synthase/GTP cyclohydrolase II